MSNGNEMKLNLGESRALNEILAAQAAETKEYAERDLNNYSIEISSDRSILHFHFPHYDRESALAGQRPLVPEGEVLDNDGKKLTVVVYVDSNSRLVEMELIRFDEGDVIGPDWSTFALVNNRG